MRRFKKLLAVGACLCMSLSLLAGCGSGSGNASGNGSSESGTKQESTKSSDLSFAFCTNTLNNTFQSSIDAKLKELCDANGISYTCLDPDYDLNTQLSQLSDVANSGYDAVFIIPVDSAGITSGLAEIKDAGIPIFNVDTAVIEDDIENFVTQFVGTNAYMAGQLVGEQMAKDYPDGADIAILDFPSNESCVDRVNGFLDGLGDNKDKFNIVAQQDGEAALDASMIHQHSALQQQLRQQIRLARSACTVSMLHQMASRHSLTVSSQQLHVRFLYRLQSMHSTQHRSM